MSTDTWHEHEAAPGIDPRQVSYLPLDSLRHNPRNPKDHALDTIDRSISRFGVLDLLVLDERTGYLISGHGRHKALAAMQARGEDPPEGVRLDASGRWLAPVITGWASRSDSEAHAALIALNRTTELGGWVDDALLDLLDDLDALDDGSLETTGFTGDDLAALRDKLAALGDPGTGEDEAPHYTPATDVPHYTPTQPEAPPLETLYDRTRTQELEAGILDAQDRHGLPLDLVEFLLSAAQRHTVIRYDRVAEFYAHAAPEVQRLMEDSALVIIDIDDAIRLGYVTMSNRLDELLAADLPLDDTDPADADA